MRLGISLFGNMTSDEIVNLSVEAEKSGFESVWICEGTGSDSFATCAVVADHTSKVNIGTDIVSIFTRHPCTLASAAATVDVISKGRFRLGLGVSHRSIVEGQLGLRYLKPVKRMKEIIGILQSIVASDQPVSYNGEIFSVSNYSLWFKPFMPHLKIYIGAGGPRMVELLAKEADGSLFFLKTEDALSETIRNVRRISAASNRKIDIGLVIPCSIRSNESIAFGIAKMTLAMYVLEYDYYANSLSEQGFANEVRNIISSRSLGTEAAGQFVSVDMVNSLCLVGDSEKVKKQISHLAQIGVDFMVMEPCFLSNESLYDVTFRTIRELAA